MLTQKFEQKLEALSQEAQQLSDFREQLINQIREVEVRLTQLTGAIAEIKIVLDEDKASPRA